MTEGTMETEVDAAEAKAAKQLSALDVLLKAEVVRQQEEVTIRKRDGLPADLTLTLGSLTDRDFKEISDQSETVPNRRSRRQSAGNVQRETDGNLFLRLVLSKGVIDPNLNDPELLAAHGSMTGDQLVQKLLLPGEIARVAEIIMDLSGFNDNTVEFAKN